jgi:glutamate--cysteine ligase
VPAFWTGLLYDAAALDAASDLVKDWTAEERGALRDGVPRQALATPFRKTRVLELARAALALARAGLQRRAMRNVDGADESVFLEPVEAILREGCTPAEEMLQRYAGAWGGRIDPLFTEYAF